MPRMPRVLATTRWVAGSVFEPFCNEPFASVYVDLAEPTGSRVHELVRHSGRHHHDLAAPRLDNFLAGREGDGALLHHEDLLVGMLVQLRAASGRRVDHDEGDTGIVVVSLELVRGLAVRQVCLVDDARHD